jgi:hypothetical protein
VAIHQQIRQRPYLPTQFEDEPTRLLCARARLQPVFADEVLASISAHPYPGIAPSYGVDLLALVRHADRTRHMHLRRNLAYAVLLLAGIVTLAVVLLGFPGVALPIAVAGVVAVLAWAVEFAHLLISTADELDTELRWDKPHRAILRRLVNNLTLGAAGVTASWTRWTRYESARPRTYQGETRIVDSPEDVAQVRQGSNMQLLTPLYRASR